MKKRLLPLSLLLLAAVLYGIWFGFGGDGKNLALQTESTAQTMPALPGAPDDDSDSPVEPAPVSSDTTAPSAGSSTPNTSVPPPWETTPAQTTADYGPFSFTLGAPKPVETPPEWAGDGLPHDKLFITVERQKYKDGQLTLIIPKLNQNRLIYDGTDLPTLNKGVGLFEYAQLPGEGNRNVSLAAHRNGRSGGRITDRAPFYYMDTLGEGDRLYLRDASHVYEYVYKTTFIVEETDWAPIYSQGFSCLTLLSCEPIGVNTHRIIVQAELVTVHAVSAGESFAFLP